MKNKVLFIIPYFGKFKNYFQLFLNSCRYNSDYNWLILTDNREKFDYPKNVNVVYMDFKTLKEKFQEKFPFKIALEHPYKLCDYKPTYGYLLNEYLEGYDFWGYCDTDLIFGDLRKFITDDILNAYDKVGVLGHLTLIRNSKRTNEAFMLPLSKVDRYKQVFTTNINQSFDEEFDRSINNIFDEYGLKIFDKLEEANVYTKSSNFKLTKLEDNHKEYRVEPRRKAFFLYEKGNLNRYILKNGKMRKKEYSYLHMQARKMKINISQQSDVFKIIPNSFDNVEKYPISTPRDFTHVKLKHFNLHYFTLRTMNLIDKIKKQIKKEEN